ncbi:short transient receptor potential channel 4-like isoform X2 [Lytechinus pictus]|uniref:short transient receptor potential channel 4-like isoform X2 n=1 Tax=Lytechinus pictus TaxID=7653 RepID=UPI0030BA08CB
MAGKRFSLKDAAIGLGEEYRNKTRGERLFNAIDDGDLYRVEKRVKELSVFSSNLDVRDEAGLNTYARAINKGVSAAIEVLLRYNVPLGDALLRACNVSYDEAAKVIVRHAKTLSDEERKAIIECRCDNDDFIKAMKPLKMAAIRNNFVVVSLLLKAGADRIKEPSLERLADAKVETISEYLDIYRLRKIGRLWEAVNKEFYDLADQVEQFCASLLDHISNSNELTTLFRQSDNPEVIHAVAQVERAVDFQQKAFVAHAYTQKIMSINFYQGLDINSMMFPVLSLLTMFGYPVICLAYILVQHPRLKTFLSIPHIKLCIFFGSDLAFFTCCAIVCFIHDQRTLDIMVPIIAVFCLGLSWKHICEIMEFGIRDFLNYTMNIIEWAILIVLYIGLILSFTGDLTKVYIDRARLRHNERAAMVIGATMTSDLNPSNDTINGGLASLAWNDPNVIAYTLFAFVILLVVIHAFYTAIITFHDLYVVWESTLGAVGVIFKFMTIYVIFHFSCAVGLSRIYHPQILIGAEECSGLECELHEQRYRNFSLTLLNLWWAFNGLIKGVFVDKQITTVNVFHIMCIGLFYVGALVLVNTLIAMLVSRLTAVQENSDTEWKFGRTKMWLRFIRTDIVLPPPFNLVPTTGFIIRLFKKCCLFCTGCTQTKQRQSKEHDKKPKKDLSAKKVIKKLLERYNASQTEIPEDREDSIGIEDLRQLREDFITVKFNVRKNLEVIEDMLEAIWETVGKFKIQYFNMDDIFNEISGMISEVNNLIQLDYPVIDVDVNNCRMMIKEFEDALSYYPEVPKIMRLPKFVKDDFDDQAKVSPESGLEHVKDKSEPVQVDDYRIMIGEVGETFNYDPEATRKLEFMRPTGFVEDVVDYPFMSVEAFTESGLENAENKTEPVYIDDRDMMTSEVEEARRFRSELSLNLMHKSSSMNVVDGPDAPSELCLNHVEGKSEPANNYYNMTGKVGGTQNFRSELSTKLKYRRPQKNVVDGPLDVPSEFGPEHVEDKSEPVNKDDYRLMIGIGAVGEALTYRPEVTPKLEFRRSPNVVQDVFDGPVDVPSQFSLKHVEDKSKTANMDDYDMTTGEVGEGRFRSELSLKLKNKRPPKDTFDDPLKVPSELGPEHVEDKSQPANMDDYDMITGEARGARTFRSELSLKLKHRRP